MIMRYCYDILFQIYFLEEDFLQSYLGKWEEEARNTAGLSREEQNRFVLSKKTRHGWNMTGVPYMHYIYFHSFNCGNVHII